MVPKQTKTALLLVVCVSQLASVGQLANGRSFLDRLMPFGAEDMERLMRRGGHMVESVREGASYAYDEFSGTFNDLVSMLHPAAAAAGADGSQQPDCERQEEDALCAPHDPDARRNVTEIIRSRGFGAQEFEVTTDDGYILTIQRIVNPGVDLRYRKQLKPVILQHGLMSSSVDWVINSVDVRPSQWPRAPARDGRPGNSIEAHRRDLQQLGLVGDTQEQPNSLGFYLANEGYDVFLANSRGNIYGQKHANLSSWQPAFWDFTFDEQIAYDLPATIKFVQQLTGHQKLGYVGHSQGTTMALGLLSERPEYADVLEPVVLLAPVAYVNNCLSPVKYFAFYTPLFQHLNMWFGSSNLAVRYLAPKVCGPKVIRREICANLIFLSCGFDESQFNESRVDAYLAHMPSGTSVKNIAHWGQEVLSGRFAHFDHGILGNQARYKSARAPDYQLSRIRSNSIALFTADNDWLASPKDVARLRSELPVAPFKVVNVTEFLAAWNHVDFVYGKDCGRLVNSRIIDIFHHFDE